MTSLRLAIYCVTPATSSENVDRPSSLREAGGVQAPRHTTQVLCNTVILCKLILGTRSSIFFRKDAKNHALPRSTT